LPWWYEKRCNNERQRIHCMVAPRAGSGDESRKIIKCRRVNSKMSLHVWSVRWNSVCVCVSKTSSLIIINLGCDASDSFTCWISVM
jgi:hypothetical protein